MITSASTPYSYVLVLDDDIFFQDTAWEHPKKKVINVFEIPDPPPLLKNKRPIDNPQPKNKSQFWNYEIPVNHKPRSRRSFYRGEQVAKTKYPYFEDVAT